VGPIGSAKIVGSTAPYTNMQKRLYVSLSRFYGVTFFFHFFKQTAYRYK